MTGRTADPIKSPKEISHFADDLMTRTVLAPLCAALLAIAAWPALADSGLPVPRFVTLKGDEVNVRAGPGRRYPINWVFLRQEMPVEVVAEFDTWRKIRDFEGTEGWVHQSLLSGRRGALVLGEEIRDLRLDPEPGAPVVARAEPGVIGQLLRCPTDSPPESGWCYLDIDGYRGWMPRGDLWGVYSDEDVD